mmetsp:Transcript_7652/g.13875  ORF Transcript_7652/g.13875 Transcript_7652/m.13875 type:complete len:82 (-) Transcript_7652:361-606(-)
MLCVSLSVCFRNKWTVKVEKELSVLMSNLSHWLPPNISGTSRKFLLIFMLLIEHREHDGDNKRVLALDCIEPKILCFLPEM